MHPPLTLHRHPMCAEDVVEQIIEEFYKCQFDHPIGKIIGECWYCGSDTEDILEQIIEEFQKCHLDHPIGKFFGDCTELKIKLDRCFRQEKAVKRKANFEQSKQLKERLEALRKETADC